MVTGGHGRGMVPTEAAQVVHEYYCRYRDWQEGLEAALQEMRQMKRGNVCIATFSTYIDVLIDVLMEEVLHDFCDKYPALNIQFKEIDGSAQIINSVLEDEAHIRIVHCYEEHPDIRCHARAPLPMYMMVNKDHPLAAKKKGSFAEIVSYPLLVSPSHHILGRIIHSVEFSEKVRLTSFLSIDSAINRRNAAVAGYGGVLMSAFAASQEIEAGQLASFEIGHPAFASTEACLIVRRSRVLSPAANHLLRLIAGKFPIFKHTVSASNSTKASPPLSGKSVETASLSTT